MGSGGVTGRLRFVVLDFLLAILWAWSGLAQRMFLTRFLGFGSGPHHRPTVGEDAVKYGLGIVNMFFFAVLVIVTGGAGHNPLPALSNAILSGDAARLLFTVCARIPSQVFGAIVGVKLIIQAFPEFGRGPRLNVEIHHGALTEGVLTFAIVIISLGISRSMAGSFFRKTWIASLCKLSLHILGSDLTGGCMNPASVMGWAYARGDHLSKEHIIVYWLAPVEATMLAAWTFKFLVRPAKEENAKAKTKKTE